MSATEIYGVQSNGEIVYIGETRNAFRGAMHVWDTLCTKYGIGGGMFGGYQELWKLADKGVLTPSENIVMKSTFDNVVVKKENIPGLLAAFREYGREYSNSSYLEQAGLVEEFVVSDEAMAGVCWNQTSVNENPWIDGYDEETEEYIPYSISTGSKHWFLTC